MPRAVCGRRERVRDLQEVEWGSQGRSVAVGGKGLGTGVGTLECIGLWKPGDCMGFDMQPQVHADVCGELCGVPSARGNGSLWQMRTSSRGMLAFTLLSETI